MRTDTPLFVLPVTAASEITKDRTRVAWSAPSVADAGGATPDERLRAAAHLAVDLLESRRPFVVEGGPVAVAKVLREAVDGSPGRRRPDGSYKSGRPGLLSILRGEPETRIARAATLATEWTTPLTLCGVCGYQHLWDRLVRPEGSVLKRGRTPGPAGPAGQWWAGRPMLWEPLAWWVRLAEVVNAVRSTTLRGWQGKPSGNGARDDALLWGPSEPQPTGGGDDELAEWRRRRANVHELRTNPATRRQQVVRVVNEWLRATCVSSGLGLPPDPSLAERPDPVVLIGSPLALIGWSLREEIAYIGLDRKGADVRECSECRITWRSQRRRTDTETPGKERRKRKTVCPWCDPAARMRESRKRKGEDDDRSTG